MPRVLAGVLPHWADVAGLSVVAIDSIPDADAQRGRARTENRARQRRPMYKMMALE
jgi:hypothetical protein